MEIILGWFLYLKTALRIGWLFMFKCKSSSTSYLGISWSLTILEKKFLRQFDTSTSSETKFSFSIKVIGMGRLLLFYHFLEGLCYSDAYTAWKVSKYGVFSGPYFSVFGLNMKIYSVNLHIQSEYRKIQTTKNSVFGYFSRSASLYDICLLQKLLEDFQGRTCRGVIYKIAKNSHHVTLI